MANLSSVSAVGASHPGLAAKAALGAARSAAGEEERDSYLARAAENLERARALAPLDADHTVNLARLLAARGELAADAAGRAELRRRAAEEYRQALRLRPRSAALLAESAALAERRGERRRALELLERAAELAPVSRQE